MDRRNREAFLLLAQLGIGTSIPLDVPGADAIITKDLNWSQLKALANEQGLSAVILDGVDKLNTSGSNMLPHELKLEWIGEVLRGEQTYRLHQEVATDMANLFHANDIRTYVLKGRIVSECYPKPEHRVSSDMDCLLLPYKGQFNAWELGNELILSRHFEVYPDFYKNSTFWLSGLAVENHQFLTPFRGSEKLASLENVLQYMLRVDKGEDIIEGTWLYRPPVMVSAL